MNKKEQIITALAELSRTRGFYRVTVDELAAHAGVSKRTIYRHFRSKDEIVEVLLERFMNQMTGKIEQTISSSERPADIFSGVISLVVQHGRSMLNPLVLDDLRRHYPELWKKIERFRAEKIQRNVVELLAGKYEGKGLREIDPRIVGAAFLASVQAVVNPEFILSNNLSFEDTVKQLIGLFMSGIIDDRPSRAAE
ncbi:MAG: TetR/AcrR family transcriptional regulator [Bacillota bacterium]